MATEGQEKGDFFGLAAYGEAINNLAKGAVDGAGAFLSRICLPAAEEFGLLLRDKVSAWRAQNAIDITQEAEKILAQKDTGDIHAHPKMVMKIISEGSWTEDEKVKSFWAGLLASSCTKDGNDESNLIFLNILSQITSLQAKIIEYGCTNSTVKVSQLGFIYAEFDPIELNKLFDVLETNDLHRIDRELDHLNSLGLIGGMDLGGGIGFNSGTANITPTPLSLQLYARCKGHRESPEYFYLTKNEKA